MDFWENKNAYLKKLDKILSNEKEHYLIRLKALRIIDRIIGDNNDLFNDDEDIDHDENED